jgi:ferric-dicitrate binding protein FerR (iron transport regulator)
MTQKKPTLIKGSTGNTSTLKSYGRAFQTVSMSAAADARIREALEVRTPRTRRWFPVVWALPLAAACGCLLFWLTRPAPTVAGACEVTRESSDTRYAGNCDVELTAMTVHLDPDAKFVQQSSGVQLDSGTAHFSVRKVKAGEPPVEIKVPEASIVVLGTEFTVTVNDQSSRVHLRSGRVRFVHQGHGAVEMWPGQQLTFETKTGKTEVVTVSAPPADDEHSVAAADVAPPTNTAANAAPEVSTAEVADVGRRRPRASGKELSKASATPNATTPTATPPSELQLALELRARGATTKP